VPHLPDHQTDHDPQLIAAYAAGDAEGADLERARDLVAACDDCAALHHDLRAIAAAMPAIPAPARTRDFRLTPEQAASLRPAGWRRLLAPLAGPRFAFAAPLGGSLAALGLAGVLLAGAASTPMAGTGEAVQREDSGAVTAAGAAQPTMQVDMSAASEVPAAPAASGPAASAAADALHAAGGGSSASRAPVDVTVPAPAPSASPDVRFVNGNAGATTEPGRVTTPTSAPAVGKDEAARAPVDASQPASPLLLIAVTLVAAGLVLVVGRVVARRLA
jgi:hypothetical protein